MTSVQNFLRVEAPREFVNPKANGPYGDSIRGLTGEPQLLLYGGA